jgi:hypothetical protein
MPNEVLVDSGRWRRSLLSGGRAALYRVERGVGILRAHVLFNGAEIGRRVNATGHARVRVDGRVRLGDHVDFTGGMIPSEITCHRGGELVIEEYTGFNYGVVIDCAIAIHVGSDRPEARDRDRPWRG